MIIGLQGNKIVFATHKVITKDANHICFSEQEKNFWVDHLTSSQKEFEVVEVEQPDGAIRLKASSIVAESIDEAIEKLYAPEVPTKEDLLQEQIDTLALAMLDILGV